MANLNRKVPPNHQASSENLAASDATSRWFPILGVVFVSFLVILPMLILGNAAGHDLPFHIASWMDVARQWREGVFYPRWAAWANFGFGEPRFIFYPPISWLAGASLGSVLPWTAVPGALIWLTLVLAGTSMFRLAKEWLPSRDAALAAVFFAANPYHLVIAYYRSDFAELIASALFPLLILGAVMIVRDGFRHAVPATFAFAAIWLVNAPLGVIASYSLVLLLIVGCLRSRRIRPLLAGSGVVVAGLGLAGFYILPAAFEQRWVQIDQALPIVLRPDNNFLFTRTNEPEYLWFNWKTSFVALILIGLVTISAVFASRQFRRRSPDRFALDPSQPASRDDRQPELRKTIWWMLLGLAAAAIFMMFRASWPFWQFVPKMRFVQFPFRWMAPLGAVSALFLAAAIAPLRRKWIAWTVLWIGLAGIAGVMIADADWGSDDITAALQGISSGAGYDGTDEYAPLGCDHYDLPENAPKVQALNDDGTQLSTSQKIRIHILNWSPEHKLIVDDSPLPFVLGVKLINYPAWQVRVNGREVVTKSADDTAQLLVPLAAGSNRIEIVFRRTWDRIAGSAVSILCLIGLLSMAALSPRNK